MSEKARQGESKDEDGGGEDAKNAETGVDNTPADCSEVHGRGKSETGTGPGGWERGQGCHTGIIKGFPTTGFQ